MLEFNFFLLLGIAIAISLDDDFMRHSRTLKYYIYILVRIYFFFLFGIEIAIIFDEDFFYASCENFLYFLFSLKFSLDDDFMRHSRTLKYYIYILVRIFFFLFGIAIAIVFENFLCFLFSLKLKKFSALQLQFLLMMILRII